MTTRYVSTKVLLGQDFQSLADGSLLFREVWSDADRSISFHLRVIRAYVSALLSGDIHFSFGVASSVIAGSIRAGHFADVPIDLVVSPNDPLLLQEILVRNPPATLPSHELVVIGFYLEFDENEVLLEAVKQTAEQAIS